ncbi:uncharacterized protein AB675_11088 [Cyphellophora attinorum]|uniref:HTH APSES-type domain-containing protein n=1 Tax=Cyphellophora attinorum TaxID=1664694 RepID=A0A0N1H420_9EURO|nr:uncharacterized protein AB675_11088 [Phialophora attinorum]KPI35805.1 hypothetical protein AB675_11088 [Phialophora attinorum]
MSTIKALLNKASSPSPSVSSNTTSQTSSSGTGTPTQSPAYSPALLSPFNSTLGLHTNHTLPLPLYQARPKPKIVKDAPVFAPGPTRGPVRYPVHVYTGTEGKDTNDQTTTKTTTSSVSSDTKSNKSSISSFSSRRSSATSLGKASNKKSTKSPSSTSTTKVQAVAQNNVISPQTLQAYHDKFSVFPAQANIAEFPRHIPYNSEKRVFLEATGRDFFEVYQFTFKIPSAGGDEEGHAAGEGNEKMWTMLWDYNTGLVRTTPLFKCCGYGKTTPAKMLNKNVGLRDICHSITGGALVAQGYWIPYLAAKHIAATFCYRIRHALTPVFGLDFIDLCVPPSDLRFGIADGIFPGMLIPPSVTQQCTTEAALYKQYEADHPTVRPAAGTGGLSSRSGSPRPPRALTPIAPAPRSPVYRLVDNEPFRCATPSATYSGSHVVKPTLRFKAINSRPLTDVSAAESDAVTSIDEDGDDDDDEYLSPATHHSHPNASTPHFRNVAWRNTKARRGRPTGIKTVPRSHPAGDDDNEDDDGATSPKSLVSTSTNKSRASGKSAGSKRDFAQFDDQGLDFQHAAYAHGGLSAYSSPMNSPKLRKLHQHQQNQRQQLQRQQQKEVQDAVMQEYEEEGYDADEETSADSKGGKAMNQTEVDAAKALLGLKWGMKMSDAGRGRAASA